MEPRTFLRSLPAAIRERVPGTLADFRSGGGFSLAQCWYGNRALHYECWVRRPQRAIEVGLHFEADALTNARLLGAFRAHERAIRRALGPGPRLEEWDRGWSRVWESLPLEPLDEELRDRVADRLARYITTLEPILREELPAGVPWTPPASGGRRRRSARGATRASSRARAAPSPRTRSLG